MYSLKKIKRKYFNKKTMGVPKQYITIHYTPVSYYLKSCQNIIYSMLGDNQSHHSERSMLRESQSDHSVSSILSDNQSDYNVRSMPIRIG